MKNSETFDRTVEILKACGHGDNFACCREAFLRHAGLALADSRKSGITAKGGKTVETFSARKVAELADMMPYKAALFAGAWAMAHGEILCAKLTAEFNAKP